MWFAQQAATVRGRRLAIYCIAGGIVGALIAVVPGLIDYF
jgi:hypothetical protein